AQRIEELERQLADANQRAEQETKRRKFMQYVRHYLGWGLVGPNGEAGVACYVEDATGIGQHSRSYALYADHGGDHEAAEIAAIEAEMAHGDSPERRDGWL